MTEFPDRGDMADRNPRTAMALTADRQTFLLVVVDGRSTSSVGMTGRELAALMGELGAHVAFNLDGGGSTQMWLANRGTVNDPSDGSPRAVANHWGVFAGTGHERGPEPSSCFTPGGCYPTKLPEAIGSRFADLPDDTEGQRAAALLIDRGHLATCGEGPREMFCPACALSRRDGARLAVRASGVEASPPASPTFSDVGADDPDYAAIEAAAREGWMSACGDGTFCPDDSVARPDLIALFGAAGTCAVDSGDGGATILRLEAATLALAAFDLDGDGSCDGDGDGDDDGDRPEDADTSGGCSPCRRLALRPASARGSSPRPPSRSRWPGGASRPAAESRRCRVGE